MMVVIVIISLFLAFFVIGVFWVIDKSKVERTNALIEKLGCGVRAYAASFGGAYPPTIQANFVAGVNYYSSKDFHYYLGTVLTSKVGYGASGAGDISKPVGPFIRFVSTELEGGVLPPQDPTSATDTNAKNIVDGWGNPLYWSNPGKNHKISHTCTACPGSGGLDNTKFVDIFSFGPDGLSDSQDTRSDNISNFYRK